MFGAIIGALGLGLSAYQMYLNAQNSRAGARLSAQQMALSEKQGRSNIRIQSAENEANLGILDYLLDVDPATGTSKMQDSQKLQQDSFQFQGLTQFNQMKEVRQQAQDVVSEGNVMAAARGLSGGAGTSAGAMGQRVQGTLNDRTTEMATMFGEDLTLDLTKGIYGQSYTELLTQQEMDTMQIESEKDILELTQEELAGQYEDLGGAVDEDGNPIKGEEWKDGNKGGMAEEGVDPGTTSTTDNPANTATKEEKNAQKKDKTIRDILDRKKRGRK